jgi:hypothetical protein
MSQFLHIKKMKIKKNVLSFIMHYGCFDIDTHGQIKSCHMAQFVHLKINKNNFFSQ